MSGEPKQLLRFDGETLLRRAVRVALETQHRPFVVLGAQAEAMRGEIDETEARVVVNQEWSEGMSSSIRCGLRAMESSSAPDELEAALVMLCDQPYVTSDVIERLSDAYRTRRTLLVASEYETRTGEKTRGVPALFTRALFPELLKLDGAKGAKSIIKRHEAQAAFVAVPEAAFDVDTPDDYRLLCERARRGSPSR